jgi:hypothetical protein
LTIVEPRLASNRRASDVPEFVNEFEDIFNLLHWNLASELDPGIAALPIAAAAQWDASETPYSAILVKGHGQAVRVFR